MDSKSLSHDRSARRDNEKCGIKLSCAQGARGLLSPDRQKVCSPGIDPIIGQQQKSGCPRSAALLVNSNTASFEICQSIDARMRNMTASEVKEEISYYRSTFSSRVPKMFGLSRAG
jgi:hypothetical protein